MSRVILALDPGTTEGARLAWDCDAEAIVEMGIDDNATLLDYLRRQTVATEVWCEWIASYGMPVGAEVFDTCRWIGRAEEVCASRGLPFHLVFRRSVKLHLCQSPKANDANIRQALLDRYGPPGTKKAPGTLYGCKSHLWSALAVAVTVGEGAGR